LRDFSLKFNLPVGREEASRIEEEAATKTEEEGAIKIEEIVEIEGIEEIGEATVADPTIPTDLKETLGIVPEGALTVERKVI